MVENSENRCVLGGCYLHFKGNRYRILNIAENTETGENMVIYRALYGEHKIYATPYAIFFLTVDRKKNPGVSQKYRFQYEPGR